MLEAKTRERDMENWSLFSPSKDLQGISAPQRCDEIGHRVADAITTGAGTALMSIRIAEIAVSHARIQYRYWYCVFMIMRN
jgi:hypothetical protein